MDWKNYAGQHALAEFVPLEHQGARMMVRRGYEDSARLLVEYKTLPAVETLGGGREAHPVVVLPTVTVPPNPPILPVLQDTIGTAVTLGNNSVFAGFDIVNTTGTAILGNGINGGEIRDISIEGTNGVASHGLHLIDTTGNIRVEQVRTTGVNGTDLFIDGGSSTINWFGGLLDNTAGRAVVFHSIPSDDMRRQS